MFYSHYNMKIYLKSLKQKVTKEERELKKKMDKLVEDTALEAMVKKEEIAESKARYILEEIAVAYKKKGVTSIKGNNYTLTLE